jgi:hypothetical protein
MELAEGSLCNKVQKEKGLSETDSRFYFTQIIEGTVIYFFPRITMDA